MSLKWKMFTLIELLVVIAIIAISISSKGVFICSFLQFLQFEDNILHTDSGLIIIAPD